MRIAFLTAVFLMVAVCSVWGGALIVAQDGTGQFVTVQRAIASAPDYSKEPTVIFIKAGRYRGPIVVPANKHNIVFSGEGAEKTILTFSRSYEDMKNEEPSNNYRGATVVVRAPGFRAEKICFENTAFNRGRAPALRVDGDRAVFVSCRILGWQGTVQVDVNRMYFLECYLEGRMDVVCGSSVAVFDRCEIHTKKGGSIAHPYTPQEKPFGLVFLNCNVTGDGEPACLGRPWGPYGSAIYIGCALGSHIKTIGWSNRDKPEWESTVRFAEYNSTGPGATAGFGRASWSRQLPKEEADAITAESVLGDQGGWIPSVSVQR